MYGILVVDGQGFYRKGFRAALEGAFPEVDVIEAECLDAMLSCLEGARAVNLAVIDMNTPGLASLGLLADILSIYPDARFAVMSASASRSDVLKSLAMGLHGFIFKLQTDSEIIDAVSDIMSGRIYVPPRFANLALPCAEAGADGEAARLPLPSPDQHLLGGHHCETEIGRLTPRQREVLSLIADGLPNKEIARKLSISEATTKIHAGALMRVLGVRNRTEAAILVRAWYSDKRI
jgi:DNA-binding NarL/FixJ family response regulator